MDVLSYKAILFDLDGVIADTARFHFEAWRLFMSRHGIEFSEEDFRNIFGMTNELILKRYLGGGLSPEEIKRLSYEKEHMYRDIAKGKITPIDGAMNFIRLAKDRFKTALVSSTPQENIDFILSEFSLEGVFNCIVSGSEVKNGKPHPECYILASRKLGINPEFCCVIEDSQHGIDAAKSAGAMCIGLLTTHQRLSGADFIASSFKEIGEILMIK